MLHKACWIKSDNPAQLDDFKKRKYQYMATDTHGRDVFLAESAYVLANAQQNFPDIQFFFTSEFK
jgi:peptide chain release factor 3